MNTTTFKIMKLSLTKSLLVVGTLISSVLGFGQAYTGTYTFGTSGNVSSFAYNGTAIANMTVGNLTKAGITSSSSSNNFRGSDWEVASTIDLTKYIEFTLTATNGYTITNPTIDFGIGRSGTGPTNWEWRSSVDNFASAITIATLASGLSQASGVITNPDVNSNWTGNSLSVTTSGLTTITFRLYAYSAEATTGTGGIAGALDFGGTLVPTSTWNGSVNNDWNTATNWTPAGVPSASNNIIIPSVGVTNFPTVTGALTNNGSITIKSGATLVQGTSSTLAGSGAWNIEQAVIGGNTTSSDVGRFYFMGSPLTAATSASFDAAGTNRAWTYNEASASYTEITTNGVSLNAGQGYGTIFDANQTRTFTGGVPNNGTINITGLTKTGTAPTAGFNMVSNPYPSYLDWAAVTRTNVDPTIWFQTKTAGGTKVFDTYNATSGLAVNNSGGVTNQYIAPTQGFWVLATGTGSLGLDNSMRSHQAAGSGLKAQGTDFPAFVRLNLIDGSTNDEALVFFHENAQDAKDAYDSDKMFVAGASQIYSQVDNSKLTMNGLHFVAGTTRSVPLTVDFMANKEYTLNATELHMANGMVFLEDKLNQTMHNLSNNDTYTFNASAGTVANRFVLHFQDNGGLSIAEATKDAIAITADLKGNVRVTLSKDLSVGGTITILDAMGRVVSTNVISNATTQLQLTDNSGMYFVRVSNGNAVKTEKIIIAQ